MVFIAFIARAGAAAGFVMALRAGAAPAQADFIAFFTGIAAGGEWKGGVTITTLS